MNRSHVYPFFSHLLKGITIGVVVLTAVTVFFKKEPPITDTAELYQLEKFPTNNTSSGEQNIDPNWYSKVNGDIRKSEYFIHSDEKANIYHSPNRAQNLRISYHSDQFIMAPRVKDESEPTWKVTLALKSILADNMPFATPNTNVNTITNRDTIRFNHHTFITEYINNEEGIRQNFIIHQAPKTGNFLRVNMEVEGLLINQVHSQEVHLGLKEKGTFAKKITYNKLKVWDALGKQLDAWMEVDGQVLSLVTGIAKATFPITIDPLSTTTDWTAESDQINAQFGLAVSSAGDVNGDGYSDVIVGAPGYDNGETDEGRVFVYHGSGSGLSATANWTAESNQANAAFGIAVSNAGDINGDGYGDVIVGASLYDNGETDEGRVFVYHGSSSGLSATADWTAESNQANALFAEAVSCAGDINGDGYSDIIVGAFAYDNGEMDEGAVFVYHGSASGLGALYDWRTESDQATALFGRSVSSAGDINGDGYSDIVIGAALYDSGQTDEGRAFVYHGSASGLGASPNWTAESDQANALFGVSVSSAGDMNGDGYSDVIVGASLYDNGETDEGRVFLFYGSASGLNASPSWSDESDQANALFGDEVGCAGDVNGDGYSDIVIGAFSYDDGQTDEGKVFVYHGSSTGPGGVPDWTAESDQANAFFGQAISSGGDVNGDGYSDLIIGASFYDNGEMDEGRTFVYHGAASGPSDSPDWSYEANQATAYFGESVSGAGDVNGDGFDDVIIGAQYYDNGEYNEGRAYVFHGSSTGLNTTPAWIQEPNQGWATFGVSVSSAGDVNGDGYDDVIVGADKYDNGQSNEGVAFVYHGSATGLSTSPDWIGESNKASSSYGISVSSAGDVNGDGYDDVIVGADFYDNAQTNAGAAYVYHGSASGLSTTPDWMDETNQSWASFGVSVSSAGDVNGDGYDDIIVGSYKYDNGETDEGRAYVYHGSDTGVSDTANWITESNQGWSYYGYSVSSAGDVNGDGYDDVVVGAERYSNGQSEEGGAFVYSGSASGLSTTANWILEPDQNSAYYGRSVSAADVNGDGYSDILAGGYLYDNGQFNEGRAFAYFGSPSGPSSSPDWTGENNSTNSYLGKSISNAGDVNGDGFDDIVVGAHLLTNGESQEGTAYIYHGGGNDIIQGPATLYDDDLVNPYSAASIPDAQFGIGMPHKSFLGRQKGKLVWEVKADGDLFSSNNTITNSTAFTGQQVSFSDLGITGLDLRSTVAKLNSLKNKVRVRVKYDQVTNITGQVYSPWRYPGELSIASTSCTPVLSYIHHIICNGDSILLPDASYAFSDGTYLDTLMSASGCDSIITTDLTVNPTYTITAYDTICNGDSLLLPGGSYASSTGSYNDTFMTSLGCDSIIITELTVNLTQSYTSYDTICNGDSLLLPGGNYASATGSYVDTIVVGGGCDSVITTMLTVNPTFSATVYDTICNGDSILLPGGNYVSMTGTYNDTLSTSDGCDSIIITQLLVQPTFAATLYDTICNGDTSFLPWGAYALTTGSYLDTLTAVNGCDSIVTIELTVHPSYANTVYDTICSGDSLQLPSGSYTSLAGTYSDTFVIATGCDSIITTILTVNLSASTTIHDTICSGDSLLLPGGNYVSLAGTYNDTLNTSTGCDSIINTILVVNPIFSFTVYDTVCHGDSILLPGGEYASFAGTYIDTLSTSKGCDSIITTELALQLTHFMTVYDTICNGDSLLLPGGNYASTSGSHIDTLTTVSGCDSIISTELTVNPSPLIMDTIIICSGDSFLLPNGNYTTIAGIYNDTLITTLGCDSIIITNLTVMLAFSTTNHDTICIGDSFLLPSGNYVNTSGTYTDTIASTNGCDSAVTNVLAISPSFATTIYDTICNGDSLLLPSGSYTSLSGTYHDTLNSFTGCDSIITTILTINSSFTATIYDTICSGDSLLLPGGYYVSTAGNYTDTLNTVNGCDSIIITSLTINSLYTFTYNNTICSGDTFTLPGGSYTTSPGTYVNTFAAVNGCDSIITTILSVSSNFSISIVDTICSGDSFLLPNGSYASISGMYTDTLSAAGGCDSIVTINLTVMPAFSSTTHQTICDGDSFLLPGGNYTFTGGNFYDTLTSTNGCDSILHTVLTVNPSFMGIAYDTICSGDSALLPGGNYAFISGLFNDTLTSSTGCDSVIITEVTTHASFSLTQYDTICNGDSLLLPGGYYAFASGSFYDTLSTVNGCDSIISTILTVHSTFTNIVYDTTCSGDSVLLPGGYYTSTTGIFYDTLSTVHGCDSIIISQVTVNPSFTNTASYTICTGDSILLPGGYYASTNGTFFDTLSTVHGCDSIFITHLSLNTTFVSNVFDTICNGDSIQLLNGNYVSNSGTFYDTLNTTNGCDSVIITHLLVTPVFSNTVFDTICDGDSLLLPGGSYALVNGTFYDTLSTVYGCDSIIITNLLVNPSFTTMVFDTICTGDSMLLPGGNYGLNSGTYYDTLYTNKGCDSIIITNLTMHPVFTNIISDTICNGDSVLLPNGSYASVSGTYVDTLVTMNGCDSIITTMLTVHPTFIYTVFDTICNGDSLLLPGGGHAAVSGIFYDTLGTKNGCDSIIITTLTVKPVFSSIVYDTICNGDSILLPRGLYVFTTGTFYDTLSAANSCDSIVTTILTVHPTFEITVHDTICNGDSVQLPNGTYVSIAGTYVDTLVTVNGCDSIITSILSVNPSYSIIVYDTICSGDSLLLPDGTFVSISGNYTDTLHTNKGCDSIITTMLTANPVFSIVVHDTICDGDSLLLPSGNYAFASGNYIDTLHTINGCDSIISTLLTVNPSFAITISEAICEGDSIQLPSGDYTRLAGNYIDTFSTASGCDSIIITNVTVHPAFYSFNDSIICIGDSVLLPNGNYAFISGNYIDTLTTVNGCDSIIELSLIVIDLSTIDAGNDTTVMPFDEVQLNVNIEENINVEWSPSIYLDDPFIKNPIAEPEFTTTYRVIVESNEGCNATDSITITVDDPNSLMITNVITPDGNGKNENWLIDKPHLVDGCKVAIYSRVGNKVYESVGYDNQWNGISNGTKLPEGVYYYIITCGKTVRYKGAITLIR